MASQVKAGAAYVELMLKQGAFNKGLQAAQQRLQSFGKAMSLAGGAVVAGGAAVGGPILAAAKAFASAGDQVHKMAARTGASTEALSTLGFAAEQSGADLKAVESGIQKMQRTIGNAIGGSKSAAEALNELGVAVSDLEGLATEDQFKALADGIEAIDDPARRTAAAMKVFGEGGAGLLPLLAEGRAGIEALQAEARDLGLELTVDDANSAAEATDAMNRLQRAMKAVSMAIGAAVAPALTGIINPVAKIVAEASRWVRQNSELVVTVLKVATGVAAAGAGLIALGAAFVAAGAAIGGVVAVLSAVGIAIAAIKVVIGALLTPVGLVAAAVVGLGGYLLHTSGAGAAAIGWLSERFHELRAVATESFGAIGKALAAGDVGAAAKILWLTLKMEWLKGVTVLKAYWQGFSDWFRSAAASMIYGIAGVIVEGWAGIESAWTETIGFLADTWSLFTGTLAKTWHNTVGFIKKAWVRLKGLFDSDLDVDAEVRRIDGETSAKTAAANEEMLGAIGARGQDRAARRAEIERDRQQTQDALASMQTAEEDQRAAAGRAAVDQAAAELDLAKKEWKDAVAAINEEETASDSGTTAAAAAAAKQALAASGPAVAAEAKAIESRSTFNAFSIRGLGADSLSDRQLRAAERTAANTEKLIKAVEESGLAYG